MTENTRHTTSKPRAKKTAQQRAQENLDRADRRLTNALKAQAQHEEALANIRPEVERARAEREYAAQHPALAEARRAFLDAPYTSDEED